MKKTKIVTVMSAGLLTLSALGGTAFAHFGPGTADATYEKIADALGEDQETVSSAFEVARDEARDEAIAAKLARLVEAGTITQTEAGETQAWYDSAPDALNSFRTGRGHADIERVAEILGIDPEMLKDIAGSARSEAAVEAQIDRLNQAVADGMITQEQADEMLERFEDRLEKRMDRDDQGERGERGRGGYGLGHHGFGGQQRGFQVPGDAPVLDPDALVA